MSGRQRFLTHFLILLSITTFRCSSSRCCTLYQSNHSFTPSREESLTSSIDSVLGGGFWSPPFSSTVVAACGVASIVSARKNHWRMKTGRKEMFLELTRTSGSIDFFDRFDQRSLGDIEDTVTIETNFHFDLRRCSIGLRLNLFDGVLTCGRRDLSRRKISLCLRTYQCVLQRMEYHSDRNNVLRPSVVLVCRTRASSSMEWRSIGWTLPLRCLHSGLLAMTEWLDTVDNLRFWTPWHERSDWEWRTSTCNHGQHSRRRSSSSSGVSGTHLERFVSPMGYVLNLRRFPPIRDLPPWYLKIHSSNAKITIGQENTYSLLWEDSPKSISIDRVRAWPVLRTQIVASCHSHLSRRWSIPDRWESVEHCSTSVSSPFRIQLEDEASLSLCCTNPPCNVSDNQHALCPWSNDRSLVHLTRDRRLWPPSKQRDDRSIHTHIRRLRMFTFNLPLLSATTDVWSDV